MAHGRIFLAVGEQAAELAVDDVFVGAHELEGSRRNALGALGGVSHDEHGLAHRSSTTFSFGSKS